VEWSGMEWSGAGRLTDRATESHYLSQCVGGRWSWWRLRYPPPFPPLSPWCVMYRTLKRCLGRTTATPMLRLLLLLLLLPSPSSPLPCPSCTCTLCSSCASRSPTLPCSSVRSAGVLSSMPRRRSRSEPPATHAFSRGWTCSPPGESGTGRWSITNTHGECVGEEARGREGGGRWEGGWRLPSVHVVRVVWPCALRVSVQARQQQQVADSYFCATWLRVVLLVALLLRAHH
jgi:hypothetical protein